MKNYRLSGRCSICRHCIEMQLTSSDGCELGLFCNVSKDVPRTVIMNSQTTTYSQWQDIHMVDDAGICDLYEGVKNV